jgi:type IV pilus assembly protein PilC
MPTFAYTAIDATGRERSGSHESASPGQAALDLKALGLYPTSIVPQDHTAKGAPGRAAAPAGANPGTKRFRFGRAISRSGIAIFTRQLATLIHAGVPLLRAMEVLARQERNPGFKAVIESLAETIRSGSPLSEAMQQHPDQFDRLYVNMIKAGEAGGALDLLLERLAKFLEKSGRIKGRVKSALTYPAIIVLVAGGIVTALMIFVVPKFEAIFRDLLKGAPLPFLTRAVIATGNFVKGNLLLTLGLVLALGAAGRWIKNTRRGGRAFDWLALHLPPTGGLLLKSAIARFSRTLGTLLASGVPILQALLITRDTSSSVLLREAIDVVHDRVKEGRGIAGPLESTRIFPPMVGSMIQVGEETGALPEMLARIADTYDEEVDNAVASLTSVIEPVMIVLLALVVGTIVIALFLPIIGIIQHLSNG